MKSRVVPKGLISLFSGCGGFDIGFHRRGFHSVWAADHDPGAVENYSRNLGPVAEVSDLCQPVSAARSKLRPEVIIAGPPCQGFSTVGRRDPNDPRSHLLPAAGKIAVQFKPKVVVIENVLGARVGDPAKHWEALVEQLRISGYQTHETLCDARGVGLAQRRRRVFLFAWNTHNNFPELPNAVPAGRLDEVLAGAENQLNHHPQPLHPESKHYKIAVRIGPGQKLCNVRGGNRSVHTWHLPEIFGPTTAAECCILETVMRLRRSERKRKHGDADPVSIERLRLSFGAPVENLVRILKIKGYLREKGDGLDLAHSFNGKFRRFRWDDVASTVDTRFGEARLFLHPNEHRGFTAREAARIQGFPDSYVFRGESREQFRWIGNAVPPPMGELAAEVALKLL